MRSKILLVTAFSIINLFAFAQSTNKEIKDILNLQVLKNFRYIPEQDLITNSYEGFDSLSLYFPRKSHVTEFYISAFELSNKDYREFTHYVWDSIIHLILDHTTIVENKKVINWNKPIDWNDIAIKAKIYDSIGKKPDNRIFGRQELDVEKCIYSYKENNCQTNINIYPDTMCWFKNSAQYGAVYNLTTKYYQSKDFDNFPVVGINYWQALAYCNWKTQKANNSLPRNSGYKFLFTLPTSIEWEAAANNYPVTVYKHNRKIIIPNNKGYIPDSHKLFYADKNKSVTYKYNFSNITDPNGYRFKEENEDGFLFTAPVNSYKPNINGLYNLSGNVAEWILDDSLSVIDYAINNLKKRKGLIKDNTEVLLENYPNSLFVKLGLDSFSVRMKKYKVIKGGSWNSIPFYLQNGVNQYFLPFENSNFIGCRIVAHLLKIDE